MGEVAQAIGWSQMAGVGEIGGRKATGLSWECVKRQPGCLRRWFGSFVFLADGELCRILLFESSDRSVERRSKKICVTARFR